MSCWPTPKPTRSIYIGLPLVVADTDGAWCRPGEFTLEVSAAGSRAVVLTNESPPPHAATADGGLTVGGTALEPPMNSMSL